MFFKVLLWCNNDIKTLIYFNNTIKTSVSNDQQIS